MALTPQQYATLKTAIAGDGTLSALPNDPDGNTAVAALLNVAASPDWVVWRTRVTDREIMLNGFDWTRVDNLSVGKSRIWDWMFRFGFIDPSKPNIRTGIDSTWVGTAADLAVRAAVYVHCKKNASRVQKLFSTGTGTTNDPATLDANVDESFSLTYQDVETARNLP